MTDLRSHFEFRYRDICIDFASQLKVMQDNQIYYYFRYVNQKLPLMLEIQYFMAALYLD